MPDPVRIDPERLAALIDGRLSEADAAAVRAQLAHADADTLAAYADAVAIAGELAPAAAPAPDVRPIASARSAAWRWAAPAAGLLAAGLVGVLVLRPSRGDSVVADVTRDLHGVALAPPAWTATRAIDSPITERGRAVRLGVLLVQHALLSRTADRAATDRAREIAALLEGIPGGSAVAGEWRGGASVPRDAAARAESLADPDFVRFGAWLESARTAAAARDTAWFETHGVGPVERVRAASDLSAAGREVISAVRRTASARPLDFAAVSAIVVAAEGELGR